MTTGSRHAIGTRDPSSQCNSHEIATEHVSFDWTIDWDTRVIHGSVTHRLRAKQDGVKRVVLDTNFLDIYHCWIEGKKAEFEIGERRPMLGSALEIQLPRPLDEGVQVLIRVEYSTTKDCTALGWLEKAQSDSGRLPFLYSQSQPVHSRSFWPCQDTPSVKITYDARVRSSLPEASVLMSARRISPPLDFVPSATEGAKTAAGAEWYYAQPTSIPSYLVALAAGEIRYAPLGSRTGVYASPVQLEAAVHEFEADTEKFLEIGEELFGKYVWGIYDVLVLPKSFSYGGMENSNLTFLTPTLLTGDRQLVDVVAHEIGHSWAGNLVSCSDYSSYWLNEGWTVWIERIIVGKRYGMAHRDFSYLQGRADLRKALEAQAGTPKYQRLVIPYDIGEDPDDGYSVVPYEKGSNFLLVIERAIGGLDVFLPYARNYFKTFAGQSIDTETWRRHLYAYFQKHHGNEAVKKLDAINWDGWLNGEGLELCEVVDYDTSLAEPAWQLASRWKTAAKEGTYNSFHASDVKDFVANQVVAFLERLAPEPAFPSGFAEALDKHYGFSKSTNAEIRLVFYEIALKSGSSYAKSAAEWVLDKGRLKYCRPVFRLLYDLDPQFAQKTYLDHESFWHPIARSQLRRDLKLRTA